MITSLLANLAVILLMHIFMSVLLSQAAQLPARYVKKLEKLVIIIVITCATISLLYLPIEIDGYRFDLRTIPLFFTALIHGWQVSLPILLLSSAWRLAMGGAVAMPGTFFTMLLPTLLGLVFSRLDTHRYRYGKIITLSSISWIIAFGSLVLMPNGLRLLQQLAAVHYSMYMISSVTLYTLIVNTVKEFENRRQLRFYAHHDALTGLYNHRYFLDAIMKRNQKTTRDWMVMLDIDYFKQINDTYGHLNGDKVLKEVAALLLRTAKASQGTLIVARYGGEEFICYCLDLPKERLAETLESIRLEIASHLYLTEEGLRIQPITVSIGFSPVHSKTNLHEAIQSADKALYKAKAQGRNQIQSA